MFIGNYSFFIKYLFDKILKYYFLERVIQINLKFGWYDLETNQTNVHQTSFFIIENLKWSF